MVSLSDDGGFTVLMGDILSVVQPKLPVKVIVFNNGAPGFVEREQKFSGFLNTGTELQNPNFCGNGRSHWASAGSDSKSRCG